MNQFLASFFTGVTSRDRAVLEKYIDLERTLLEQYQQFVTEELARNTDVLQNFTKMMMTTCMQVVAFQRENRARFLELQSSITETHLRFLDAVQQGLANATNPDHAEATPDAE